MSGIAEIAALNLKTLADIQTNEVMNFNIASIVNQIGRLLQAQFDDLRSYNLKLIANSYIEAVKKNIEAGAEMTLPSASYIG